MRRLAAHSHACPQPGAGNHAHRYAHANACGNGYAGFHPRADIRNHADRYVVCHANACGNSYAGFHPRAVFHTNAGGRANRYAHANACGNRYADFDPRADIGDRANRYVVCHANACGNGYPDLHPRAVFHANARAVPHTGAGNRG